MEKACGGAGYGKQIKCIERHSVIFCIETITNDISS